MAIKNFYLLKNKRKINFDVFLPVMDETFSLQKTINIIEKDCSKLINNYLIVISNTKTHLRSKNVIRELKLKYKEKIKIIIQEQSFIGGALKTAIKNINSSHFILMASDLETNPKDVKNLIAKSIKNPDKIIIANRWIENKSFIGYNLIKLILNKIFQIFFSALYAVSLSDLTFAYRVYPSKLINKLNLKETRHPILLETALIPIKLGIGFIEIPSKWRSRKEGSTNNNFLMNFAYIFTGFRIFFSNKKRLVK